jgi:nucleoside-diphosphate-sugar epimerase
MTVLLIGAGGFLGSHLAAALAAQGEAVVPLRYRPAQHDAFLADFAARVASDAPGAVIHAGGSQTPRDDPDALQDLAMSNVVLPAAIASLLCKHAPACRLLTFGTSWQTGEDGAPEPFNAYAASKTAAESFLDHFAMAGLRAATLRLHDTYGPGDRRNKVVNLVADAVLRRSDLPMSAGGQVVDLVHVRDVVAAAAATLDLLGAAPAGRLQVFAVRSGRQVTISEVVGLLLRQAGLDSAPFIRPGIYPYRARERFALDLGMPVPPGWAPRIALEDGLRELLEDRRGMPAGA